MLYLEWRMQDDEGCPLRLDWLRLAHPFFEDQAGVYIIWYLDNENPVTASATGRRSGRMRRSRSWRPPTPARTCSNADVS